MRKFLDMIPLMAIPIGIYAIIALFSGSSEGVDIFVTQLEKSSFYLPLPSGVSWGISGGVLIILLGLGILFFELIRGVANSPFAIVHHTLSVFLALVSFGLFLAVDSFGTSTFFVLVIMCILDMVGGVIVNIAESGFGNRD
jgi:hypothetical protein